MASADLPDFSNTEIAFRSRSNLELLRAITLFRMMNAKTLVTVGSKLLTFGFKLHLPLSPFVRWTVFQQFCGGESLEECRSTLDLMQKSGVRAILDYGVEGEKSEKGFDAATAEILRTAEETKTNKNIPFVVFKFTAIARFALLEKITSSGTTSLTPQESQEWRRIQDRVQSICDTAIACGTPIMIDAEETWIQGAIDEEALRQMKARNKDRAWVYTTMQMYRVDRLAYLKELAGAAQTQGWKLGIKLVRGAYMEKERVRAASHHKPSPIQPDKSATDKAYDAALDFCFSQMDHIAMCVGTHNDRSSLIAAKHVLDSNISKQDDRVWFSQLLGMSDHLTYNLASCGFNAAKYVPYGPVHAVIPYLMRRAEENSSVAGQSSRELQLLEKEMTRRN